MKDINKYINESILADDDELDNRAVRPIEYNCSETLKKVLNMNFCISFDELCNILIDIRDNNLNVSSNIYTKSVKHAIEKIQWHILPVAKPKDPYIALSIYKTSNTFRPMGFVKINQFDNTYKKTVNPRIRYYNQPSKIKYSLIEYLEEAFDKIMQSDNDKYNSFKNLFK